MPGSYCDTAEKVAESMTLFGLVDLAGWLVSCEREAKRARPRFARGWPEISAVVVRWGRSKALSKFQQDAINSELWHSELRGKLL